MSWTYSDWRNQTTYPTVAARFARLNLHIQEVSDAITASIAADGKSRDSSALVPMLEDLQAQAEVLEKRAGRLTGGLISKVILADER